MKSEKNILIAFLLNLFFSIIEFIGGLFTNSVAIISDSIHDMGDSLSIGISYFLEKKSKKVPDNKYTYGYVRYSILGAMITTLILLIGSFLVIIHATKKIITPVEINYDGMILFALLGTIINSLAAYFTKDGHSMNQKSVNLHMLEDVLGWIVVLIGAIVMKITNIAIIDPILSIFVALFILIHAFETFKSIIDLFLEKTPNNVSINEIKEKLLKINGVSDIHHIHVWSLDGFHNYATLHVVLEKANLKIKPLIREELKKYNIEHVTIEIENKEDICEEINCSVKENNIHHH